MMNKRDKTEYLLREIGEIDDKLLQEAIEYRPKKSRMLWLYPIAACLALFIALNAVLPAIIRNFDVADNENEGALYYEDLDTLMLAARDEAMPAYTFDTLSYERNKPMLIWQYEGEEEYYTAYLDQSQIERLEYGIGQSREVGLQAPSFECKVWIWDGQGNVITPYLELTNGNIGCVIFDYSAELFPSEEVVEVIGEILGY